MNQEERIDRADAVIVPRAEYDRLVQEDAILKMILQAEYPSEIVKSARGILFGTAVTKC